MATDRKVFLDQLRQVEEQLEKTAQENVSLKEQVSLLEEQLDRQGEETFEMAGATMQIRQEDAERLATFRKQNTELIQFVETVADSHSKFKKKARKILGFC